MRRFKKVIVMPSLRVLVLVFRCIGSIHRSCSKLSPMNEICLGVANETIK